MEPPLIELTVNFRYNRICFLNIETKCVPMGEDNTNNVIQNVKNDISSL